MKERYYDDRNALFKQLNGRILDMDISLTRNSAHFT